MDEVAVLLLTLSSHGVFNEAGASCDGNVLWKQSANAVKVLYPQQADFELLTGEMNLMRYAGPEDMIFSDGMDIFVFDWKGSLKNRFSAGEEKNAVEAISLHGSDIFFYRNSRVYRCPARSSSPELFVNDTFKPPYSGYFNAAFFQKGKILGLLLGIAGDYCFSSIDMESGRVINSNIRMASSKLSLREDGALYIYGSTGNWFLARFTFSSGRRELLQQYRDLVDVDVFDNMLIAEDGNGLWILRPGGEHHNIPFAYELKGACGRYAVMKYGASLYCVDVESFYDRILKVEEAMPDIFRKWEQ
jgi:hypothetical protein